MTVFVNAFTKPVAARLSPRTQERIPVTALTATAAVLAAGIVWLGDHHLHRASSAAVRDRASGNSRLSDGLGRAAPAARGGRRRHRPANRSAAGTPERLHRREAHAGL